MLLFVIYLIAEKPSDALGRDIIESTLSAATLTVATPNLTPYQTEMSVEMQLKDPKYIPLIEGTRKYVGKSTPSVPRRLIKQSYETPLEVIWNDVGKPMNSQLSRRRHQAMRAQGTRHRFQTSLRKATAWHSRTTLGCDAAKIRQTFYIWTSEWHDTGNGKTDASIETPIVQKPPKRLHIWQKLTSQRKEATFGIEKSRNAIGHDVRKPTLRGLKLRHIEQM